MADDRERLQKLRRLKELRTKKTAVATKTAAPEKPYDPTEGMSGPQKFAAGVGSGATRIGRRALNLTMTARPKSARFAGLDLDAPNVKPEDWYSDESVRAQAKRDAPLGATGAGMAGQFVGEMAATAPLGAVGTSTRAAAGAVRAAPALARALGMGAEGAAQGVVSSAPGEAGQGAATGAAISSALGGAGAALKRTLQGVVRKSPEAEMMETIAAQHGEKVDLPLSQAASKEGISGIMKDIYGKILPLLPGSSKNKVEEGIEKFRNVALKESSPRGLDLPDAGKDVHGSMKILNDAFENAYMDLGKDSSLRTNLLRTKINLQRLATETGDDAFLAPLDSVESLLKADFIKGSAEDLARYEALADPWENFLRVRRAAANTDSQGGRFTPTELKKSIKSLSTEKERSQGSARLQDLAEVGEATVGQKASYPSFAERSLANTALRAGGILGSPVVYPVNKILSSKTTEKALLGDTTLQRAILKKLRDRSDTAKLLGSGAQGAVIAESNDGS